MSVDDFNIQSQHGREIKRNDSWWHHVNFFFSGSHTLDSPQNLVLALRLRVISGRFEETYVVLGIKLSGQLSARQKP